MPSTCTLKFGRSEAGYRLCIEGRGTMQDSRAVEAFVAQALACGEGVLVVDLTNCTYLDSTFLGCLVGMHRQHGSRLKIAAPPEQTKKLFGPTKIDVVLRVT